MEKSFISSSKINRGEAIQGREIRDGIFTLIKTDHPGFSKDDYISLTELNRYRRSYLTRLVRQERGEEEALDQDVLTAIRNNSILTEDLNQANEEQLTTGQKLADRIALFGGSWTFIIIFFLFLVIWMVVNVIFLASMPFDPYPFILLNLILSSLAAVQAPIIMMSQNRQEEKDRQRAEMDYKINLKAELEIKLLNDKIDHLLVQQNKKLLEIQEVQVDYLEDLIKQLKGKK